MVKYSKPTSVDIPYDLIILIRSGEEFDDKEQMNCYNNYMDDRVFWVREHSGNIPPNF